MLNTEKLKKMVVLIIFLISLTILYAEIPKDTIVAEFEGGQITMEQLEERLLKIPPMYQPKYSNPEGKAQLLDMLCTEEIFYKEALTQDVEQNDKFYARIDDQIKSTYFNEFKKDLLKDVITYTSAEKKAYFNEHSEMFVGRTYEESEQDIERRMLPNKEREFIENTEKELMTKYKVEIIYGVIKEINLTNIDSNQVITEKIYITSSNPEIEKTIGEFIKSFDAIPPHIQGSIKSGEGLKKYIEDQVKKNVFYLEALEKGYGENETIKETISQIKRNMMLRTVYNLLVVEAIGTNDEDIKAYYDNNIEKFSTKHYRKIQTFGFDSKDTAKKLRKLVKKYMKKNDDEAISKLIEEKSVYPAKDGVLDHIYKNDIIPGIGKDEVYSDMVWKAKLNKLSKIFENSKGKFVFFRMLEDNKTIATPFEEIKGKVKNTMIRNLSKEKFEEVNLQLETKYNLKKYPERMIVVLSAEEYFNKAEQAQKKRRFTDAIFYYDEIIKYYQNNSDDYKATFMKAFLYAEELKDKNKAIEIFDEFLEKYPEGDLHESAKFMVSELEGKSNIIESFESENE